MSKFSLTPQDKEVLLKIVQNKLNSIFNIPEQIPLNENEISLALKSKCGVFVSLYNNGQLRACLGRFNSDEPLYSTIEDVTQSTALSDYRFEPIKASEIDALKIEISVVSPLEPIDSIDLIELGKHGIYIKKGMNTGTFLPQVANKMDWTVEEFVGHCSESKARIGWYGWKDADLFRYEAIIIHS